MCDLLSKRSIPQLFVSKEATAKNVGLIYIGVRIRRKVMIRTPLFCLYLKRSMSQQIILFHVFIYQAFSFQGHIQAQFGH